MRIALPLVTVAILSASPLAAAQVQDPAHMADTLGTMLTARTSNVDARLTEAINAGRMPASDGEKLKKKLAWVRSDSARYVKEQGFLSAGESASYNRTLDEVEQALPGQ